jgi:hypothetical protein
MLAMNGWRVAAFRGKDFAPFCFTSGPQKPDLAKQDEDEETRERAGNRRELGLDPLEIGVAHAAGNLGLHRRMSG